MREIREEREVFVGSNLFKLNILYRIYDDFDSCYADFDRNAAKVNENDPVNPATHPEGRVQASFRRRFIQFGAWAWSHTYPKGEPDTDVVISLVLSNRPISYLEPFVCSLICHELDHFFKIDTAESYKQAEESANMTQVIGAMAARVVPKLISETEDDPYSGMSLQQKLRMASCRVLRMGNSLWLAGGLSEEDAKEHIDEVLRHANELRVIFGE